MDFTSFSTPVNLDAEKAVLGGLLQDVEAMGRVFGIISPEMFYDPSHRKIYQIAEELFRQKSPTDYLTVITEMTNSETLEEIGGVDKITELVEETTSSVNIDHYACLIREPWMRRELYRLHCKGSELAYDQTLSINDVINRNESMLYDLTNTFLNLGDTLEKNRTIAPKAWDALNEQNTILSTGILDIDNLIGGLERGTLIVVGGHNGTGKSHIGLFLCSHCMLQHEKTAVFFSLEMQKYKINYRLWSWLSVQKQVQDEYRVVPIDSKRFREHRSGKKDLRLTDAEKGNANILALIASELPFYIDDNRILDHYQIGAKLRRLVTQEKEDIGVVIIDYVQRLTKETDNGRKSSELGRITDYFFNLAKELNVAIVLLSQIKEDTVRTRQDKRPTKADLAGSKMISDIADNIILLYRDEIYNPDSEDKGLMELIVDKSRDGITGTVKVLFDPAYGSLSPLYRK